MTRSTILSNGHAVSSVELPAIGGVVLNYPFQGTGADRGADMITRVQRSTPRLYVQKRELLLAHTPLRMVLVSRTRDTTAATPIVCRAYGHGNAVERYAPVEN